LIHGILTELLAKAGKYAVKIWELQGQRNNAHFETIALTRGPIVDKTAEIATKTLGTAMDSALGPIRTLGALCGLEFERASSNEGRGNPNFCIT
jgi:hypothetical protein